MGAEAVEVLRHAPVGGVGAGQTCLRTPPRTEEKALGTDTEKELIERRQKK